MKSVCQRRMGHAARESNAHWFGKNVSNERKALEVIDTDGPRIVRTGHFRLLFVPK